MQDQSTRRGPSINIDTLDFLRGFAAVMVVINHCRGSWQAGGRAMLKSGHATIFDYIGIAFNQTTSLGSEFVIVFFFVSGYSMANSIFYTKDIPVFYLKRIIRIWPPYLLAASVVFILCSFLFDRSEYDIVRFLGLITYTRVSTPLTPQFWSLPYEVMFYIICPLILRNRSTALYLLIVSGTLTIVTVALRGPMLNPYSSIILNFIGNELFYFSCGAAFYHFGYFFPQISGRNNISILIFTIFGVWSMKVHFNYPNFYSSMLALLCSAIAVANLPSSLGKKAWYNLGYCSYSIYLFHYMFIALISLFLLRVMHLPQSGMTSYYLWMLGVPPVLLLSMSAYLLAERRSNAWVRKLRRGTAVPPAVSGP